MTTLSKREIEVLTYLIKGLSVTEIHKSLNISPNTVSTHIARAKRKLGAKNTVHAVVLFAYHQIKHFNPNQTN